MKTMVALAALILLLTQSSTQAQEQTGNGGDPLGDQATDLILDILGQADQSPSFQADLALTQSYDDFKKTFYRNFKIEVVDHVYRNGDSTQGEVCMENFPNQTPKMIQVGRTCWDKLTYSAQKALLLHEMLGITHNEDSESYLRSKHMLPWVSCNLSLNFLLSSESNLNLFESLLRSKGYFYTRSSHADYIFYSDYYKNRNSVPHKFHALYQGRNTQSSMLVEQSQNETISYQMKAINHRSVRLFRVSVAYEHLKEMPNCKN